MAKSEKITDDLTHEEIQYPYISVRSIRVELSPTEYAWLGSGEVLAFANGENLGTWAKEKMERAIENGGREREY